MELDANRSRRVPELRGLWESRSNRIGTHEPRGSHVRLNICLIPDGGGPTVASNLIAVYCPAVMAATHMDMLPPSGSGPPPNKNNKVLEVALDKNVGTSTAVSAGQQAATGVRFRHRKWFCCRRAPLHVRLQRLCTSAGIAVLYGGEERHCPPRSGGCVLSWRVVGYGHGSPMQPLGESHAATGAAPACARKLTFSSLWGTPGRDASPVHPRKTQRRK